MICMACLNHLPVWRCVGLALRAFRQDVCSPLISFVNSANYPADSSPLKAAVVDASSDFRLDNNKYVYRHFGLFNAEYDVRESNSSSSSSTTSPSQPSITFNVLPLAPPSHLLTTLPQRVTATNIHVIAGIFKQSAAAATGTMTTTNYGYNTIRSIVQIITSAQVQIKDSAFLNSFLNDGFLSNIFDYAVGYSALTNTMNGDCSEASPCSDIRITSSTFSDYNDLFWRMSDAD